MCMNAVEEPGEVTQDCQMLQSEWHMILESHGHSVEKALLVAYGMLLGRVPR